MKWISVKDRLPENSRDVLVYAKNDMYFAFYNIDICNIPYWEFHESYELQSSDVTHWMPLPKPPKEK